MRSDRVLALFGLLSLTLAGSTLLTGVVTQVPWLTLVLLLLGLATLAFGVIRGRGAPPVQRTADPARSKARAKRTVLVLGAMGLTAGVVAVTVAVGEARGHAIFHLLFGVVSLGLFAALAFPWHPRPGTSAALVRGTVLVLLGIATFGAFLESIGGAGYDAENAGRRLEALTTLHGVAIPFSVAGLPGLLLGALVGVVVFTKWAVRRQLGPG
jgi:hypothetical protein